MPVSVLGGRMNLAVTLCILGFDQSFVACLCLLWWLRPTAFCFFFL
jgi:hypothetical protein